MNDEAKIRSYRRATIISAGTLIAWGALNFILAFLLRDLTPTKYDDITNAYNLFAGVAFIVIGASLLFLRKKQGNIVSSRYLAISSPLVIAFLFWGVYFSGFFNFFYKSYETHFYEPTRFDLDLER